MSDSVFLGWPDDLTSPSILGASPLGRVSSGDARFLLFHGEFDADVFPAQAVRMKSALDAAGVPGTLVIVEDADHIFDPVSPATATSPRFTDASPGTEAPVMLTTIVDFFEGVANGSTAVASLRSVAAPYSTQVAAESGQSGAAERRFLEAR